MILKFLLRSLTECLAVMLSSALSCSSSLTHSALASALARRTFRLASEDYNSVLLQDFLLGCIWSDTFWCQTFFCFIDFLIDSVEEG